MTAEQNNSKKMNIALWAAQVLVALAFGMAGFLKSTAPIAQLAEYGMTFVSHYSTEMVRFIGITEILAAIGLILPAALRIKPFLTPLAAVGVAIIMILAFVYHLKHNEPVWSTVAFFAIAVFIAWGRFIKVPIRAK